MSDGSYEHIKWTTSEDGSVGNLYLDRPPLNILHTAMLEEITASMADYGQDGRLKVVVCRASPDCRAFSAGVDIADHTAERVQQMIPAFHRAVLALAELEVPTIAAVDGSALGGGCEVAMACDLVIASDRAKFGQPEVKLAALAPVASAILPRAVGRGVAADWLLTGRTIDPDEALAAGLVSRVLPAGGFQEAVDELAEELSGLSGATLRLAKRALAMGSGPEPLAARIGAQEKLYLEDLMSTEDIHEGLAAFAERRSPSWKNR